jgi:hypothetical protein
MLQTQWIPTFGGVIGINLSTAFLVAQALDIEVTPSLLHKLKLLESWGLEDINKKGADANGG